MGNAFFILLAVAIVVGAYVVSTYNQLVKFRTRIKASIQEIGNQLKRQANLIPNLEESTKAYLKHEKEIYKQLSEARKAVNQALKSGSLTDSEMAAGLLTRALQGLRVVVESNPELKASQVVSQLMDELRDTADKVMYARRTLIDLTAEYNIKIQTFPSKLVADMFGFQAEKGLQMDSQTADAVTRVDSQEAAAPKIKLD